MDSHVPTLAALAEHFGVVRSAVSYWRREYPGFFEKGPQGYSIARATEGRALFEAERPQAQAQGSSGDIKALRARKLKLEGDKIQASLDVLRGKYAPVEDVLSDLRVMIYVFKDKLLRLPAEMAYEVSGVSPAEAEEKLAEYIHRILTELSETQYEALAGKLKSAGADVLEEIKTDARKVRRKRAAHKKPKSTKSRCPVTCRPLPP